MRPRAALPAPPDRPDDRARATVVASVPAGRDVRLVLQIRGIHREAPATNFVINDSVEQSYVRNHHQLAVDAVAEGLSDVTDATAEAEPLQRPFLQLVVQPERSHVLRYGRLALADLDGIAALRYGELG